MANKSDDTVTILSALPDRSMLFVQRGLAFLPRESAMGFAKDFLQCRLKRSAFDRKQLQGFYAIVEYLVNILAGGRFIGGRKTGRAEMMVSNMVSNTGKKVTKAVKSEYINRRNHCELSACYGLG